MVTCLNDARSTECLVKTNYGLIQGKRYVTKNGIVADCFLGVPYAKPPMGELRFKKPQRMEPWEGVKKCRQFGNRSVQEDMFWDKVTVSTPQSEDCLYLNIFAPPIDPTKSYPVLFYIHGGGFMMDSAVKYKQIVSQEVIVVTIQYRLGYLGFFCTGDGVAKGNYGLWDQLEAKYPSFWRRSKSDYGFWSECWNIWLIGFSQFLFSQAFIDYCPSDMFHRKIVMGGSSFCYWSTTSKEKCAEYCRQKALKLGWKPRPEGIFLVFRQVLAVALLGMHMIGNDVFFNEARLPLAPVIDGEILPKAISELRAEAPSMDSIAGVGRQESLLFMALGAVRGTGKDMDRLLHELSRKTKLNIAELEEVVARVYGDLKNLRRDRKSMQNAFVTCLSDTFANFGCYRYLEHSQKHDKPTYAYCFDYTSRAMWGWFPIMIPYMTGTHCSDIIYLFDCNYFSSPFTMTKKDRKISKWTSTSFMQFVKTGNPNIPGLPFNWEPVSKSDEIRMLNINEKPAMAGKVSSLLI
ncbi:unnamed protein product [Haemonchus placei]|uniref:COesterase domain-containing protein n=1 Tax=Haemonchus placei TaxID=6290 RepID=A0A0N4W5L0_HAEPC|nr:unnamed protein product [Haemonchus placei]